MKNFEIYNANMVLGNLSDVKLAGKLKFKLFKNKKQLESAVDLIISALDGVEKAEERSEILGESQDVKIDKFTVEELEALELSMRDIGSLQPLIDFGEEEVEVEVEGE